MSARMVVPLTATVIASETRAADLGGGSEVLRLHDVLVLPERVGPGRTDDAGTPSCNLFCERLSFFTTTDNSACKDAF